MKSFIVVLVVTFALAAAISTYAAGAESGVIGFTDGIITETCISGFGSDTQNVLANSQIYNGGANCGKLVKIVCADSSKCTASNLIWGVITSLCDTCGSAFTLTRGAFNAFAPGVVTTVAITYEIIEPQV